MKKKSGTRMAENVLYADLNLPESTRPRILKVPDVPGCIYAEVKVKSQDANDTTNFESSRKSRCYSRRLLAVLAAVLVVAVLALTLCWTLLYGATAGSQEDSTTTIPEEALDGATAGSQQNSTKLPPSHEGAPGKRCCSRTRVAVLVTGIILLLLIIVCQILPCKSRCYSRRLLAVLAAVLVVAVLALTLCWTLLYGATAGSQEHSTTTIPEEALGCPPKWEKHGRKCYFFSPETKVKDWNASRDECAAMGSELVIIDSREELNYLCSRSRYNYYLLGLRLSQEEKKWKWLNNVEHDPAMFNISGNFRDYLCTVIGFHKVQTAPCYGSLATQNMCEKAATVSARLQKES
ncbi:killer cell lectin-like receptor subfamily B member 1 isoform X4 [Aphelocoma coerulescens]|uniref:killer cell lectin-like receptor subfamily B member 1 isoform X4 n=1 Tax=Aphelocoma coerulescens TaxID=39617 RepID=UPI003604D150